MGGARGEGSGGWVGVHWLSVSPCKVETWWRNRCPRPSRHALTLPLTPALPPPPTCVAPPILRGPALALARGSAWRLGCFSVLLDKSFFFFQWSPSKIQHHLLLSHLPPTPPSPPHGASYFVSEGVNFGVCCWCVFLPSHQHRK